MRIKGFRVEVAILAALLVVGILFAGRALWLRQTVDEPLLKIHQIIPAVKTVRIIHGSNETTLEVQLTKTDNLENTYEALQNSIQELKLKGPIRINILDHRNARLEEAYYQIHFSVQEAAENGDFEQMKQNVQSTMQKEGIKDYRVYVGDQALFVQIAQGNNYLYEIVPRLNVKTPAGSLDGGGGGNA